MSDRFEVVAAAGTFQPDSARSAHFPHRWTKQGVSVETEFTGAHLLHLAVAACILNDTYREAAVRGIDIAGVRVTAAGGFDVDDWTSTGITYSVQVDSSAPAEDLNRLMDQVDQIAEIPRALRAETSVRRIG